MGGQNNAIPTRVEHNVNPRILEQFEHHLFLFREHDESFRDWNRTYVSTAPKIGTPLVLSRCETTVCWNLYPNAMPEKDPSHWLYRFTSDEWLRASAHELIHARRAFLQKAQREGVTHSRRAAGMAVNALLWHRLDETYGRSFMEHLATLMNDAKVPDPIRQAAGALVGMSLKAELVTLGKTGDPTRVEPAERILAWAKQLVAEYL